MGGLALSEEWMGVWWGKVVRKGEERREGELCLVYKMKKN